VKQLIKKHHACGEWHYFNNDFEVKEDYLQLMGWKGKRRVILVRRKLRTNRLVAIELKIIEIKNQWGWRGYTTRNLNSCGLMARIIALIYNWWTLFVRLANPCI
jgi:hypothetical protein